MVRQDDHWRSCASAIHEGRTHQENQGLSDPAVDAGHRDAGVGTGPEGSRRHRGNRASDLQDPALSSKILRTVNSSFYGRANTISTISHALVLLGLQAVKTLVLGFSLVGNLSKAKSKGFKHVNYWRRSVYAATAARMLASKLHIVQ